MRNKSAFCDIMKPILRTAVFIAFMCMAHAMSAQKIFTVSHPYNADVRVYVVDAEYKADLLVYRADKPYRARANENRGIWYFTDKSYNADKKIYFAGSEYAADLKIFFVDREYKSGWRKDDKKHMMY